MTTDGARNPIHTELNQALQRMTTLVTDRACGQHAPHQVRSSLSLNVQLFSTRDQREFQFTFGNDFAIDEAADFGLTDGAANFDDFRLDE